MAFAIASSTVNGLPTDCPWTETTLTLIVAETEAFNVTVTLAKPSPTGVTTPVSASTVKTAALPSSTDQTFLSVCPSGKTVRRVLRSNVEPKSTLVSVAENEPGSLILLTCENESVEGGYLNRRVVFAKPQ